MDRVESPEIDPHKYSQLIFDKRTKQCNGVNIVIYANGAGTAGHTQAKKKTNPTNVDRDLKPIKKVNSKWITDLYVKL